MEVFGTQLVVKTVVVVCEDGISQGECVGKKVVWSEEPEKHRNGKRNGRQN